MRKNIAMENNLDNIREYFEHEGYNVDIFDDTQMSQIANPDKYEAIIVAGGNKDFMGVQDTSAKVPVIDASGMTPQDVFKQFHR